MSREILPKTCVLGIQNLCLKYVIAITNCVLSMLHLNHETKLSRNLDAYNFGENIFFAKSIIKYSFMQNSLQKIITGAHRSTRSQVGLTFTTSLDCRLRPNLPKRLLGYTAPRFKPPPPPSPPNPRQGRTVVSRKMCSFWSL